MTRSAAPGPDGPDDPAAHDEDPGEIGTAEILDSASELPSETPVRPHSPLRGWLKLAAAALALVLALAVVLGYRAYQERRVVAISTARAAHLLRADTWLGDQRAADLLGVRAAKVDPLQAGSLRGLALAMLAVDYRDRAAAGEASATLVEPGRASQVPSSAQLAVAALALAEGQAGTAMDYVGRAGEGAPPQVLAARVALLAGNQAVAAESVERALAADPDLPSALALRGDLLRRAGRAAEARTAYTAALASSARALQAGLAGAPEPSTAPGPQPRAAYGLAKLALSRELPPEEATGPLTRLLDDRAGTPQVERARAALYLAALRGRAGDRGGATQALDQAGLELGLRGWLERAAAQLEVERGRYRVPDGTPGALLSASDDDPYVPPPPPPARVEAPPKPAIHGFKVHPVAKKAKTKAKAKKKPKSAARGLVPRRQANP